MNKLAKAFQYQALERKKRLELIEQTESSKILFNKWKQDKEVYLNEAADLMYNKKVPLEETIYLLSEKFAKQIIGLRLVETQDKAYKFAENLILAESDIQEEF
jgi:hypothetical protein